MGNFFGSVTGPVFKTLVPGLNVVVGDLVEQVQEVQADVKNKLEKANAKYKMEVDKHRWFKSFDVGNGFH